MLDHFVASFVFVCVRLLERAVRQRKRSSFGDGMEATATLLLMPLQLTLVVLFERLQRVYGRDGIPVVFKRAVLRRRSIVRKEIEVGAVRGESCDLCMTGRVRSPNIIKGLVPRIDKSRSVIGAL